MTMSFIDICLHRHTPELEREGSHRQHRQPDRSALQCFYPPFPPLHLNQPQQSPRDHPCQQDKRSKLSETVPRSLLSSTSKISPREYARSPAFLAWQFTPCLPFASVPPAPLSKFFLSRRLYIHTRQLFSTDVNFHSSWFFPVLFGRHQLLTKPHHLIPHLCALFDMYCFKKVPLCVGSGVHLSTRSPCSLVK